MIPTTAPQDEATTDLVHRLRDDVLPPATDGTGLDVAVTGTVAVNIDFSDYLAPACRCSSASCWACRSCS